MGRQQNGHSLKEHTPTKAGEDIFIRITEVSKDGAIFKQKRLLAGFFYRPCSPEISSTQARGKLKIKSAAYAQKIQRWQNIFCVRHQHFNTSFVTLTEIPDQNPRLILRIIKNFHLVQHPEGQCYNRLMQMAVTKSDSTTTNKSYFTCIINQEFFLGKLYQLICCDKNEYQNTQVVSLIHFLAPQQNMPWALFKQQLIKTVEKTRFNF